jgi:hypothetical protein
MGAFADMRPIALLASLFALVLVPGCEDGPDDAPPPGDFACGKTFCDTLTQICVVEPSTVAVESGATCENVPAACNGEPACDCAVSCTGGTCAAASDGSITVTCTE